MKQLQLLRLHIRKLLLGIAVLVALCAFNIAVGELKPRADWNAVDLLGEGGTTLIIAIWALLILASRPAGRVTTLLYAGLLTMFAGCFQDFTDELVRMPATVAVWHDWLESMLMLAGMVTLTVGIFLLHREQLVIINQLSRRERIFREHDRVDRITQLGDAGYLRKQLQIELAQCNATGRGFAVLLVDIDRFSGFNREHGHGEGNRMLREIGELMLMNLRPADLLCRYAGDRFAVLMPGANEHIAGEIASQLTTIVEHFSFKTTVDGSTVRNTVSIGAAVSQGETSDDLLARATDALEQVKRSRPGRWQLAA
ncbi:GGDEF domain-containing protein [uncultured Abyssibacter sp.]|uniref:GGDEF domain-containing protein n=1 Tax=uncultured Abyssibacter sp. TaxID=2320202 RepID=UPI0032B23F47